MLIFPIFVPQIENELSWIWKSKEYLIFLTTMLRSIPTSRLPSLEKRTDNG